MRNRTLISRAEGGGLPFTFHEHICIWTGRLSEYLRVYSMARTFARREYVGNPQPAAHMASETEERSERNSNQSIIEDIGRIQVA